MDEQAIQVEYRGLPFTLEETQRLAKALDLEGSHEREKLLKKKSLLPAGGLAALGARPIPAPCWQ